MTQHVRIIYSYHRLSFRFQTFFLCPIHIGHSVYVGYNQPGVANSRPHMGFILIETNLGSHVGASWRIFRTSIIITGIINLINARIPQIILIQIRQAFNISQPHRVPITIRCFQSHRQISITVPQNSASILSRRKDRVNRNIRTGGLLQEFISES